jgi:DNA-directed RNA polymerase specialized sigma24 family protein
MTSLATKPLDPQRPWRSSTEQIAEVMRLRKANLGHTEISEKLGLPYDTVRSIVRRSLKAKTA